ncbi:MAG: choice-of-anchor L domain-containing protein, partial [Olleya sp.]
LSTGSANSAGNVQNTNPLNEGTPTWTTDPDLEAALGINNTLNATSIEFDFISTSSTIQFNYILASEEYFAEYPCLYSDGFAFLIREAGSGNPYQNIAMVPGTNIPVNTNTIHDEIVGFCPAENNQYFEGYNLGDTNFNGRTTVLTASASITPNVQYNIKLIVADQTDRNFDTAVFIEGNSFTDSVDLGEDITTCDASVTLNANTDNTQATYVWSFNNTIINGETTNSLLVNADGNYTVEITVPLNNITCTFEDSINVALNTIQTGSTISDIEVCDDASNDGEHTFDLSTKISEVEATLPSATYTTTFHVTQGQAESNSNAITSYFSTNPTQVIHYRAQNDATGCVYIGTFNLVINPFLSITNPTPLITCYDGGAGVDLSVKDDEITNSNSNYYVNYHLNQIDADNGSNQIYLPYTPTNNTETLFVSVIDITTGCSTTTTLDIQINTNPPINPEVQQLDACEQDGDGYEAFDLTETNDDVLQGLTNVTVTYHLTAADAFNGLNPIENPTNFTNTNDFFQTVFIRVEDNITGCVSVVPLELHTLLLESETLIADYFECDDSSNDGIVDFDLIQVGISIINGVEDVTIDFYETEADQLAGTNPINQNLPYEVDDSPRTIYFVLTSPTCTYNTSIQLIINDGVEIQPLITQQYCDTDSNVFTSINLTSFNDYVSEGIDDATVSYYQTQTDSDTNSNPLPAFYYNTTNPLTVFVNVQSNSAGCSDTAALTIEVLPAPETTTPAPTVICDDDEDGYTMINLTDYISTIVTSTANKSFSFHNSQINAITASAAITNPSNYNANTQIVFCRIENTVTGCFSVEIITIYVNTLPVFDTINTLVSCETDGNQIGEFIFS